MQGSWTWAGLLKSSLKLLDIAFVGVWDQFNIYYLCAAGNEVSFKMLNNSVNELSKYLH